MKKGLGCIFGLFMYVMYIAISIGIVCALASWMCNISDAKSYTWYSGIWQGIFFIPNLVRYIFDSSIHFKAPIATLGYNIWWWIMATITVLGIIGGGIGNVRRDT